ncbi:DUF2017 family protein [Ornithinimicrobium flavum]|uniref:DUF2017 family protein n=1 Tax=Ornithinimicrobium flavum TaxID=1288636 RepID=UPI00106FA8DF|nr:DUF2017 family protein [Ornithinimicrobium flavum]
MATAFRRKGSRLVGGFDEEEIAVIVHVLGLTHAFVAPERPDTGDPFLDLVAGLGDEVDPTEPEDPALARLLPSASREDPEQAADFRRMTEHGLRSRKAATLATAIAALEEASPPRVDLDLDQARALAIGLTDARLILVNGWACGPTRTPNACTRSSRRLSPASGSWTREPPR